MIAGVQNTAVVPMTRPSGTDRLAMGGNTAVRTNLANTSTSESVSPFIPKADAKLRAGFGDNTVSTTGMAATALDRGVKAASKVVPKLEDLMTERRERWAQSQQEEVTEPREMRLNEGQQAAYSSARNYMTQISSAAQNATARVQGDPVEPAKPAVQFTINGQPLPSSKTSGIGAQFDVSV